MVSVGDQESIETIVTEDDIKRFANLTGDKNPLHLNREKAKDSIFDDRIAHGVLIEGFISATLEKFEGTIILKSKQVDYTSPVNMGDEIRVMCEVIECIDRDDYRINIEVFNKTKSETAIEGEAVLAILT